MRPKKPKNPTSKQPHATGKCHLVPLDSLSPQDGKQPLVRLIPTQQQKQRPISLLQAMTHLCDSIEDEVERIKKI